MTEQPIKVRPYNNAELPAAIYDEEPPTTPYNEEVPEESSRIESIPEPVAELTAMEKELGKAVDVPEIKPLPMIRQIRVVLADDAVTKEEFEKFKKQTIAGLKHLGLDVQKFFI